MIHSVTGISDDIDLDMALREVIAQCRQQLGEKKPQVGLLFSSCLEADFSNILSAIIESFPGLELVGCTTDGEINRETGFIEDSISLMLLASDTVEFATAVAQNLSQNAESSFTTAFSDAKSRLNSLPACGFVFPDGLTTINIALEKALQVGFGSSFPFFGSTSGDRYLFTKTYQFHNDRVYTDAAPVLLLGGDLQVHSALHKGPMPTGVHYNLDRHENNIAHQIDGKTALAFFQEHLGNHQEQFSHFPLAVYEKEQSDFYLRIPLHVNDEDGSITFVGELPDQCTVRLTLVSRTDILEGANQANQKVMSAHSGSVPEVILLFPCASLRHVLGSKTREKFSLLLAGERKIPLFGFYSYGEITPSNNGTPAQFHNYSYMIVALSSEKT